MWALLRVVLVLRVALLRMRLFPVVVLVRRVVLLMRRIPLPVTHVPLVVQYWWRALRRVSCVRLAMRLRLLVVRNVVLAPLVRHRLAMVR